MGNWLGNCGQTLPHLGLQNMFAFEVISTENSSYKSCFSWEVSEWRVDLFFIVEDELALHLVLGSRFFFLKLQS